MSANGDHSDLDLQGPREKLLNACKRTSGSREKESRCEENIDQGDITIRQKHLDSPNSNDHFYGSYYGKYALIP